MFNTISWLTYGLVMGIATLVYYASLFFRILHRRGYIPSFPIGGDNLRHEGDVVELPLPSSDSLEQTVSHCLDELQAFFESARRQRWQKAAMLQSLRKILIKYPQLRHSPYQVSLSNVIQNQSEHMCSILLGASEVGGLWRDR